MHNEDYLSTSFYHIDKPYEDSYTKYLKKALAVKIQACTNKLSDIQTNGRYNRLAPAKSNSNHYLAGSIEIIPLQKSWFEIALSMKYLVHVAMVEFTLHSDEIVRSDSSDDDVVSDG